MLPAIAFSLGLWEILLIVLVILLLFGTTQIPKLMRNVGAGVHEFKDGIKEGDKKPEAKPGPEPDKK
jgi:sec-independent protein translocase protein TatA